MPHASSEQKVVVKAPGMFNRLGIGDTKYLQRLNKSFPNVKLLMVVRNPIDRLVSDIAHTYSVKNTEIINTESLPDLDKLLINDKIYVKENNLKEVREMFFHLSNYPALYTILTKIFPPTNILVVDGDNLIKEPAAEMERVERYLNISPYFNKKQFVIGPKGFPCFNMRKVSCMQENKGRHHPKIKKTTEYYLQEYFSPIMEKFQNMTGVNIMIHQG